MAGLNVTIPYKADAARLANVKSERVAKLGAANTLVKRPDGTIYADNTDVLGFARMLNRFARRTSLNPRANFCAAKKPWYLAVAGQLRLS